MCSLCLVVTEKPDAARRIARALGTANSVKSHGTEYFEIPQAFDKKHYVVCSAAGHLYSLGDPSRQRRVYPCFDMEWFPSNLLVSKPKAGGRFPNKSYGRIDTTRLSRRILVISELARRADMIIHACDYDIEGETIGYNIIKYACENDIRKVPSFRAKFSTLTEEEIRESFSHLKEMGISMAQAGRARHVLDFLWGINLSRALSESCRRVGGGFRNITIGRVQGPTLSFVVDRDIEVKTHVPIPYWSIRAILQKDGKQFVAHYNQRRIDTKQEAEDLCNRVSKESFALVKSLEEKRFSEHPPFPFNLGDLQKEAFRLYKFSPSLTLSIAEKLYLQTAISYPRTNSQKIPPSVGYSRIISRLIQQREYSSFADQMKDGRRRKCPVWGYKEDPAHPAIYPTGNVPRLDSITAQRRIYDLIVRRFLAAFAEDALRKEVHVTLLIGDSDFLTDSTFTLKSGWRAIYPIQESMGSAIRTILQDDLIPINSIQCRLEYTQAPRLYTQSSLLERMESENIGTKATRAEAISTLINRDYVIATRSAMLESTETGLNLVQTLRENCNAVVSTELTRKTEEQIGRVENGNLDPQDLLTESMIEISSILERFYQSEEKIGTGLGDEESKKVHMIHAIRRRDSTGQIIVGNCPSCRNGNLEIMRSFRTRKRFLRCSNYSSGCRTSAPLPKRGRLRSQSTCPHCEWPIISVSFSRKARLWSFCPNPSCPSKQIIEDRKT